MNSDFVVISSFARTPIGSFQGILSGIKSTELGAAAVAEAVSRAGLSGEEIDRIYMGCVLAAGLGQAPARQAGVGARLPHSVEATTINKMCGSGMQAVILATETLLAGAAQVIVAGGMESMSGAPYLLPKYRGGGRMGHGEVKDSMMLDGLEDAYVPGKTMGAFAEDAVRAYQFSRQDQDAYAIESLARARAAIDSGAFGREIVPVDVKTRDGNARLSVDEQPSRAKAENIPRLRPAFEPNGTITSASSASISDGAAALVVMRMSKADRIGVKPVARVIASAAHSDEPHLFTTAPVGAIRKLLERANWSINDVDLFEINEAFAVVPMIAMRDLGIPWNKLNVNGGACALGHPIGASGARILATLIAALHNRGMRKGVASICIGGGEATAIAVELLQ